MFYDALVVLLGGVGIVHKLRLRKLRFLVVAAARAAVVAVVFVVSHHDEPANNEAKGDGNVAGINAETFYAEAGDEVGDADEDENPPGVALPVFPETDSHANDQENSRPA